MIHDVIVVGLGAMGSATLWQLARRGVKVLGIDRYAPPHDRGSSHGHSRITRLAVGEGPEFVPLVRRSHEIWREIEAATGEALLRHTGGLIIGSRETAGELHGQADFVGRTIEIAQRFGIPHQELDAREVGARWPQFLLRGDERAYFEADAGLLLPEHCVAAQLGLARRAGAQVLVDTPVLALGSQQGLASVTTAAGVHRAARVVVTAGAWTPGLAGGDFERTLKVYRQTLHWFRPDAPEAYAPERCPVFIWSHGPSPADSFYGLPMGDGPPGLKLATQQYDRETTPEQVDRLVAPEESHAVYARHVRGRLAGVGSARVAASACLYTVQASARFVVDRHPCVEQALVVSACSGHGFKHSAALGEALAQQLTEGRATIDLGVFGWTTSAKG
jgi:sarcosine oxidase